MTFVTGVTPYNKRSRETSDQKKAKRSGGVLIQGDKLLRRTYGPVASFPMFDIHYGSQNVHAQDVHPRLKSTS